MQNVAKLNTYLVMSRRQSPSARKKSMFDRRFLWLIIFILIPLIPLLNNLGPSEGFLVPANDEPTQDRFARTGLQVQKSALGDVPATWVNLPNSDAVRVSVLTDRQPLARPEPPANVSLSVDARHGYYVATVTLPLTTAALESGTRFLDHWLPAPTARTRYALSGDLTDQRVMEIGLALGRADAPGSPFAPVAPSAVTAVTGPLPGQVEYEAFVIGMDLLSRRLDGYNPRLRWDHSERQSKALLNITLAPAQRGVPPAEDFQAALARRRAALTTDTLNAAHIHRQMITLAGYDLPADTLTTRLDWLDHLDFEVFASQWEVWFGPNR